MVASASMSGCLPLSVRSWGKNHFPLSSPLPWSPSCYIPAHWIPLSGQFRGWARNCCSLQATARYQSPVPPAKTVYLKDLPTEPQDRNPCCSSSSKNTTSHRQSKHTHTGTVARTTRARTALKISMTANFQRKKCSLFSGFVWIFCASPRRSGQILSTSPC